MAAKRSKDCPFMRDFKRLLLPNRLANGPHTLHAWSLGEVFSKVLKLSCSEIQDGRRLKIAQILKQSSSREPPAGFRQNLAGMIDVRCSFKVVKLVALE
jgi:hypothetical protein